MTTRRTLPVAAIVLTWNTAGFAIQTLESLADGFAEGLRIVLVDNGSVDDSVEVIKGFLATWLHASAVTLIESPENLGFPGGVNLGTEHALAAELAPEYLWLVNPDATVAAENLAELLRVARETGAGITSAPEGGPGCAGQGRWPRVFFGRARDYVVRTPEGARWVETGRCAAWCALFDVALVRRMIAEDGHFEDPGLFLDWDEWDCSLRAHRKGYPTVAAIACGATHSWIARTAGPSPMAKARQYYQSRNAILVSRRNMSARLFWSTLPLHIARDLSWFMRLRLRGEKPNERSYVAGAVDGVRGKSGRWKHHPATPNANR